MSNDDLDELVGVDDGEIRSLCMKILLLDDITTLDILKIFQELYLMPL